METQDKLLADLQFLADSGWEILKGALPAKRLRVMRNEINGDISLLPVFDGFHDRTEIYYSQKDRKNISPSGDLWYLLSTDSEITLGISLNRPKKHERGRGEFTGKYIAYKKQEKKNCFVRELEEQGSNFKYDSERRIFLPDN